MAPRNEVGGPVRLADKGIDLSVNSLYIKDGEAQETQNLFYRNGLNKRPGYSKYSTNAVAASKEIVGLHRFYSGVSTRILFATAGTVCRKLNGDLTWTDIRTGLTDSTPMFINTWGSINQAFFANGVDVPFYSDGTTTTALAVAPPKSLVILPYRSRLLSIDRDNPSDIRWSGQDYSIPTSWTTTAQALRMFGPGAIDILALHGLTSEKGYEEKVLVQKPTSSALLSGFDFDPTSVNFEFRLRLDEVSSTIGCSSPRTVVGIDKGTIFLGSDRQVYLLPYGSLILIPIGEKIRSVTSIKGIESIPLQMLSKACAIYEDGFYKLSISTNSLTENTVQFWLDVNRLYKDEETNKYGPWYGPHIGQKITLFSHNNSAGDDSVLLSGDYSGFVNNINNKGVYSDDGIAITCRFHSRPYAYSGARKNTKLTKTALELLD